MKHRRWLEGGMFALALTAAIAAVAARPSGGGGVPPGSGGAWQAGSGSRPGGAWAGGRSPSSTWHGGPAWRIHGGAPAYSGGRYYSGAAWYGWPRWYGGAGWYGWPGWSGGTGWYGWPGWYGGAGWYGWPGWFGGWYGPSVALSFGLPAYWGWPVYSYTVPTPAYVPDASVGAFAPAPDSPPVANYWYYCTDPAGYFPYVQNCNKPWIPVTPSTVAPAPSDPGQQ